MKLSDIFKLDLNTGGGNKLFARIINKYNVPKKEYENVKQEMNSFSGGGDTTNDIKYYHLKVEYPDDVVMEYSLFASIFKLIPTDEAKELGLTETIIGNATLAETTLKGIYSMDFHYFGTIPFVKKGEVIYNSIEEYCVSTGINFDSYFERITEEEFLNS